MQIYCLRYQSYFEIFVRHLYRTLLFVYDYFIFRNPTTSSAWYKVDGFDNLWKNFHDEQHYFDLNDFSMHDFSASEFGRLKKWEKVYEAVNERLENKKNKKSDR